MEYKEIITTITREEKDSGTEEIKIIFNDLEKFEINLSENNVEDLKKFFDIIFDYIVEEKKLIKFILEDEKQDLYNEIVLDVLEQINNEISVSKENFEKIFDLLGNKDDIF
jgi:hypothetical protein